MNMHGNDWGGGRHRSAATFLASIMMRGKIIWWTVGVHSIPFHPGPGRMRIPPPSTRREQEEGVGECATPRPAAAAVHGRGGSRHGSGSWTKKAGAGCVAVARNLVARLVIHVAGVVRGACLEVVFVSFLPSLV